MSHEQRPIGPPAVRLSWSWRWAAAFVVLLLALHEAHELAHTWLGRLLCGSWGARDFNTWSLAEGCEAAAPAMAGPVFTYAVLWTGTALLWSRRPARRHLGLALLFASNPFVRILTVALGGGDELVVASRLLGGDTAAALWPATTAAVLAITVPALLVAWRALRATPRRWLWFSGLLFAPTLVVIGLVLVAFNGLLSSGFGATPSVLGEPLLVLAVTTLVFVGCAATCRWLVPDHAR